MAHGLQPLILHRIFVTVSNQSSFFRTAPTVCSLISPFIGSIIRVRTFWKGLLFSVFRLMLKVLSGLCYEKLYFMSFRVLHHAIKTLYLTVSTLEIQFSSEVPSDINSKFFTSYFGYSAARHSSLFIQRLLFISNHIISMLMHVWNKGVLAEFGTSIVDTG